MKYIFTVLFFLSGFAYADEFNNGGTQSNCTYGNKIYSLGFVLVLEDGKKFLRCTKTINSDATKSAAWVEIQTKKPSEKDYKIKE